MNYFFLSRHVVNKYTSCDKHWWCLKSSKRRPNKVPVSGMIQTNKVVSLNITSCKTNMGSLNNNQTHYCMEHSHF